MVEPTTYSDFVSNIRTVLETAGMQRILAIHVDGVMVCSANDEEDGRDYWDKSFFAALGYATNGRHQRGQWWILVSGANQDFKFRTDVAFNRTHARVSPSIRVVVRALPTDWAPRPGESSESWLLRLRGRLRDKTSVKAEEDRVRPLIMSYLDEFERLLKESFGVAHISRNSRINLSEVDLKSLRENYQIEHVA